MATSTSDLERRGLRLEYLTVGWNVIEAVVAVAAGLVAKSIALIGFGLDSTVEIFAAGVVIWQLQGIREEREERALRLIGNRQAASNPSITAAVVCEKVSHTKQCLEQQAVEDQCLAHPPPARFGVEDQAHAAEVDLEFIARLAIGDPNRDPPAPARTAHVDCEPPQR